MPSNSIHTTTGTITPPRAKVPASKLVEDMSRSIAHAWAIGGDYGMIASLMVDVVAHHISTAKKLDPAIAYAIEQHLDHDPLEGDADADAECSVEEIEAWHARKNARLSVSLARQFGVHDAKGLFLNKDERDALVGAMLKRPGEVLRYRQLRAEDKSTAAALATVLAERKAKNAADWKGGAL